MVKYPGWGVNGKPTNIEDIVINEIAHQYLHDEHILYDILNEYEDKFDKFTDLYYADEFNRKSLDDPEDIDYYGESLDTLDAIFTSTSNGFTYDYPYEIAYIMCGKDWQNKLAELDYKDEQDVIDTFYKMAKVSLDDAFSKYVEEELDKLIKNYS